MVECFENDHKVNSKCFICNSIIVLLRDDLNTVYIVKIRIIWVYRLCSIISRVMSIYGGGFLLYDHIDYENPP